MSSLFADWALFTLLSMDRSTASNIRIACIAVATYDFFLTIPAEWRIYRSPRGQQFIRVSTLLFFLVRYLSVVLLIIGSCTFWAIFKCLQTMVVQLIMSWRTYNISQRHKPVLYFLTSLYITVVTVQFFTSFYGRKLTRPDGECSMASENGIQWVFYLCCVVWDVATLLVSLFYLSRIRTTSPFMTKLTRTMCVDGLVYFVAMTAINALNMLIFLNLNQSSIQGTVVTAYTASWILSQWILINLNNSASEKRNSTTNRTRTVTVSVSNSAEELGMEVTSRLRSAQEQTGLSSRNLGQRYRQRVHGTVQSTSGELLDSVIEIDIGPRSTMKNPTDEANQSGPSRECNDHGDGDDDSFFDLTTDSGIDTNRDQFPRRNEGPLMTTRRF